MSASIPPIYYDLNVGCSPPPPPLASPHTHTQCGTRGLGPHTSEMDLRDELTSVPVLCSKAIPFTLHPQTQPLLQLLVCSVGDGPALSSAPGTLRHEVWQRRR